jgi:hypothetical protein
MAFIKFTGKIAEDQKCLTRQFIQLHSAFPSTNDLFFDFKKDGSFIFDGAFWREFELDNLLNAAAEEERQ